MIAASAGRAIGAAASQAPAIHARTRPRPPFPHKREHRQPAMARRLKPAGFSQHGGRFCQKRDFMARNSLHATGIPAFQNLRPGQTPTSHCMEGAFDPNLIARRQKLAMKMCFWKKQPPCYGIEAKERPSTFRESRWKTCWRPVRNAGLRRVPQTNPRRQTVGDL